MMRKQWPQRKKSKKSGLQWWFLSTLSQLACSLRRGIWALPVKKQWAYIAQFKATLVDWGKRGRNRWFDCTRVFPFFWFFCSCHTAVAIVAHVVFWGKSKQCSRSENATFGKLLKFHATLVCCHFFLETRFSKVDGHGASFLHIPPTLPLCQQMRREHASRHFHVILQDLIGDFRHSVQLASLLFYEGSFLPISISHDSCSAMFPAQPEIQSASKLQQLPWTAWFEDLQLLLLCSDAPGLTT